MPGFVWFFVVVVGIPVVAGVLGDAFKRHLRFKERQLAAVSSETAEKAAQYAAQVERLEQRVRVLERIITDRGMDLATDIERLRDAPLN
jgi:cell division protein FtsB